jgi:hypothetical protein
MKPNNFLILIGLSFLLACGPATSPETISVNPQAVPSPTRHPTPSLLLTAGSSSPITTPVRDSGSSPIITPMAENKNLITPSVIEPSQMLEELPPGAASLVAKAKEMLTQIPGIDITIDDIVLVATETRQWRDSSLGCPRQGMMYNQVITPGYLIVLRADGKEYEFHTNSREAVVLCFINGEDALEALQK